MGVSGRSENVTLNSGSIVFLNGILINSGVGFNYINNGGTFRWASNIYSGITGAISVFQLGQPYTKLTGVLGLTGNFPRRGSMVYLNGVRSKIDDSYVENSTIDLISQSGIFGITTDIIYNNEQTYFE